MAGCVLATLPLSGKRPRLMLQSFAPHQGSSPVARSAMLPQGHVADYVAHALKLELDRRVIHLLGGLLALLISLQQ